MINFDPFDFKSELWCGCIVATLAAPYVAYAALLKDNELRIIECSKCGATWLESDVPLLWDVGLFSDG